jgi:hypothetical protein
MKEKEISHIVDYKDSVLGNEDENDDPLTKYSETGRK